MTETDQPPPPPDPPLMLTSTELARRLGVTPRTVRRWVVAGILRPSIMTLGGHARFTPDDVAQLIAAMAGKLLNGEDAPR